MKVFIQQIHLSRTSFRAQWAFAKKFKAWGSANLPKEARGQDRGWARPSYFESEIIHDIDWRARAVWNSFLGIDSVICILEITAMKVWNSCFGLDLLAADLARQGRASGQSFRPLAPSLTRGRTNFKQRLTAEKKPLITPPAADDRRRTDGRCRFANGSFDG